MMNSNELPPSAPMPTSLSSSSEPNVPLDRLSYKELQVLAMSLNLPGKMKQGVLVEAIRARQNQNEVAVAMILEANRQRKLVKRHEQQQIQQQQLMRINAERGAQLAANNNNNSSGMNNVNNNVGSSRRKSPFPRPRMKRPASEMTEDVAGESYLNDENLKRSKLVAALTQQYRRPAFFNHAPVAFNQRKEQQQHAMVVSTCGTWEPPTPPTPTPPSSLHHHQQASHMELQQQQQHMPPMAHHRPLPDLSAKDLSLLPALNDCGTTPTPPSSADDVASCGGSSAASWTGMPNTPGSDQALPNGTFDACDASSWLGSASVASAASSATSTDDSYDGWTKLNANRVAQQNCCIANNYVSNNHESNMTNQSSLGYYVEQQQPHQQHQSINNGVYNNGGANSEVYRQDDYTMTSTAGSNLNDFVPPPCQTPVPECCQIAAANQKLNPNWSNPSPSVQSANSHQSSLHHIQQQRHAPLPIAVMTSRLWFDCYDANCYHKNAPLFRIQRPGNPTSLFVPSGRSFTLPTFCTMQPRVASFIQ